MTKHRIEHTAHSLCMHKDSLIVSGRDSKQLGHITVYDMKTMEVRATWASRGVLVSLLGNRIMCSDDSNGAVIIWSLSGAKQMEIFLKDFPEPHRLCSFKETAIVVTSWENNKVAKFPVKAEAERSG